MKVFLFLVLFCSALSLFAGTEGSDGSINRLTSLYREADRGLVAFEPIGRGAEKTKAMQYVEALAKTGKSELFFKRLSHDQKHLPAIRLYGLVGLLITKSKFYPPELALLQAQIGNKRVPFGEMGVLVGEVSVEGILARFKNEETLFRIMGLRFD